MNTKSKRSNHHNKFLLSLLLYFTLMSVFYQVTAQNNRAVMGEMATCKVTVNNAVVARENSFGANKTGNAEDKENNKIPKKIFQPKANQLGFFDQISNLKPLQVVTAEILYPQGKRGEKVIMSAEDGGRFDNAKMIYVSQLDAQGKVSFNFHLSDQSGIFHVSLRKGSDVKVIQLWVGADPFSAKN